MRSRPLSDGRKPAGPVSDVYPRLCVPIEQRPEGGLYTFIGNLTTYLDAHGIGYTRDVDEDYDVLFVNSWVVPYRVILRVKRRRPHVTVVQRVDGSAVDYGRLGNADARQARVNLLADLTIFQSVYSRYSTREKYRVIAQDGPVIYNPVDTTRFCPGAAGDSPPGARLRVASASFSTNPMKGLAEVGDFADDHQDVDFVLCGPIDGIRPRANLHRHGHLDRQTIAEILRSCDVFLNLSENDPCPNVVLEALATGLPVLYKPSGGVPELVGDCGAAVDRSTFRAALDRVQSRLPEWKLRARARAVGCFAPDNIFPAYLDAIAQAERRPLPTARGVWGLARAGYPVLPQSSLSAFREWASHR
jgi:glycosyltransferase involved in cell wall biosynthesis